MRLHRLKIVGYKRLEDVELLFNDATFLIGQNNTGKSSILNAIGILLSATKQLQSSDFHSIIDEETGIRRGSIGQSVEAILSKVENINLLFEEIMLNQEVDLSNKHNAALIYAYYKGEESLPFFQKLRLNESWLIPQIIEEIKEYQWINLYG